MAGEIAAKGAVWAVALGGALGALARYGLVSAISGNAGGFPVGTFAVNSLGCALIGVLMVTLTEMRNAHPLARPFLGVGVLGGFTTFSAYTEDARALIAAGALPAAAAYLAGTVVCAVAAVVIGMRLTRWALRR